MKDLSHVFFRGVHKITFKMDTLLQIQTCFSILNLETDENHTNNTSENEKTSFHFPTVKYSKTANG